MAGLPVFVPFDDVSSASETRRNLIAGGIRSRSLRSRPKELEMTTKRSQVLNLSLFNQLPFFNLNFVKTVVKDCFYSSKGLLRMMSQIEFEVKTGVNAFDLTADTRVSDSRLYGLEKV